MKMIFVFYIFTNFEEERKKDHAIIRSSLTSRAVILNKPCGYHLIFPSVEVNLHNLSPKDKVAMKHSSDL